MNGVTSKIYKILLETGSCVSKFAFQLLVYDQIYSVNHLGNSYTRYGNINVNYVISQNGEITFI